MKRAMQARRRALRNGMRLARQYGRHYVSGLSEFGSKKKPKPWTSSPKRKTVAQQRAARQAARGKTVFQELFERTGKRPRAKDASRYTVKKRQIEYKTINEPTIKIEKVYVPGHLDNNYRWIKGRYVDQPTKGLCPVKKPVAEKLILRRFGRKKGGPGGTKGTGAERGISHRTGTLKARKMRAKQVKIGGTRGGKTGREKKKQPKVIGKKKP